MHCSQDPASRLSFPCLQHSLLGSLQAGLEEARLEETSLQLQRGLNTQQTKQLELELEAVAKTYEVDKFKLQVEELGKVVSLLLSLSGRLVRVENALLGLDWNGVEEREELEGRRTKLVRQVEEASLLRATIERRTRVVGGCVATYLGEESREGFFHVMKTMERVIVALREVQEKVARFSLSQSSFIQVKLKEIQVVAVSQLGQGGSEQTRPQTVQGGTMGVCHQGSMATVF